MDKALRERFFMILQERLPERFAPSDHPNHSVSTQNNAMCNRES